MLIASSARKNTIQTTNRRERDGWGISARSPAPPVPTRGVGVGPDGRLPDRAPRSRSAACLLRGWTWLPHMIVFRGARGIGASTYLPARPAELVRFRLPSNERRLGLRPRRLSRGAASPQAALRAIRGAELQSASLLGRRVGGTLTLSEPGSPPSMRFARHDGRWVQRAVGSRVLGWDGWPGSTPSSGRRLR
jgi:hypothetical protein